MRSGAAAEHRQHSVITVAGGWQGLDIVHQGEDVEEREKVITDDAEISEKQNDNGFVDRLAERYPRTFHVILQVILPLFFIILICFFCGYFLARFEAYTEMQENDSALAAVVSRREKVARIAEAAKEAPSICLDLYEGPLTNRTQLEEHMKECGRNLPDFVLRILKEVAEESEFDVSKSITFNWIFCGDDRSRDSQMSVVNETWTLDMEELSKSYESLGLNKTEAQTRAFAEASGHDSCRVNAAAGALFWLTIATTIGYGNTAPVTSGGRALVYTFGFASILVFTALIGKAGNVCIIIADDFFRRRRILKRLSKGIVACLFWFTALCLWLLVISGVAISYINKRTGGSRSVALNDAIWFSYISVSTVGLGDFHVDHTLFLPRDMFYVPLCFLVGFVLLANFLMKLSDILIKYLPCDRLEENLRQSPKDSHIPNAIESADDTTKASQVGKDSNASSLDPVAPCVSNRDERSTMEY